MAARGGYPHRGGGPLLATWFGASGKYATDWTSIPGKNSDYIDDAIAEAVGLGRPLHFPMTTDGGVYVHNRTIAWTTSFAKMTADPGVSLVHTGSGVGVSFDGGSSGLVRDAGLLFAPRMHGFHLRGNANTTVGLYLRSVHQGHFSDIRVEESTTAALQMWSCSSNAVKDFVCSVNQGDFLPKPTSGVWIGQRPSDVAIPGWTSVMNVFENMIIEGLDTGTGLVLDNAVMNRFATGTSEGNMGGISIGVESYSNKFDTFTMVSNTGDDIDCYGAYNVFENCQSQRPVLFRAGSRGNVLGRGGTYTGTAVTNSSIYAQRYDGPVFASGVVLTDAVTAGDERRIFRSLTGLWGST